jgi:hypothetical protein
MLDVKRSERVNLKLSIPSLGTQQHSTTRHPPLTASKTERWTGKLIRIHHPRPLITLLLPAHRRDRGTQCESDKGALQGLFGDIFLH